MNETDLDTILTTPAEVGTSSPQRQTLYKFGFPRPWVHRHVKTRDEGSAWIDAAIRGHVAERLGLPLPYDLRPGYLCPLCHALNVWGPLPAARPDPICGECDAGRCRLVWIPRRGL